MKSRMKYCAVKRACECTIRISYAVRSKFKQHLQNKADILIAIGSWYVDDQDRHMTYFRRPKHLIHMPHFFVASIPQLR